MMDPKRVRAYLQVACAGLGFEIGEVWWTSNETGSSTLAAIEEKHNEADPSDPSMSMTNGSSGKKKKRIRFLQLYTSKSYGDQRSKLVAPPSERRKDVDGNSLRFRRANSADLDEHVLSPRLVEAISSTAQVVWANCQRREGLLGRSDVRLQTAVGMPVAMDGDGNMCIVVMFSPNNVQSTDEAMEYLQSISKSAASSSIPCLLPVVDRSERRIGVDPDHSQPQKFLGSPPQSQPCVVADEVAYSENKASSTAKSSKLVPQYLGEGVTARFVSFDTDPAKSAEVDGMEMSESSVELHTVHELSAAPKDCYGIPMLPSLAELGNSAPEEARSAGSCSPMSHGSADAFDEASYGVWSTIMNTPAADVGAKATYGGNSAGAGDAASNISPDDILVSSTTALSNASRESSSSTLSVMTKPIMSPLQKEKLEEFASAFLGMSVFDAADVWIPASGDEIDLLHHVTSVTVTEKNTALNYFKDISASSSVKLWSGAVGRAFGSGNPVWSTNQGVIVDANRATAFDKARIKTALAVPIYSSGAISPACVLCCYSLVRADSVPFVLRFVQQALRLLWEGLDRVEPHESVGKEIWRDVAPADLGEMAADMEMQKAFLVKKRPHDDISSSQRDKLDIGPPALPVPDGVGSLETTAAVSRARASSLSLQLQALNIPPSGPIAPTVGNTSMPDSTTPATVPTQTVQTHVQEAVRSVGDAVPWPSMATNENGTKRAHLMTAPSASDRQLPQQGRADVSVFNLTSQPQPQPQAPAETGSQVQHHQPLPQPQPLSVPLHPGLAFASVPDYCQGQQSPSSALPLEHVNHSNKIKAAPVAGSSSASQSSAFNVQQAAQNNHKEDPAVALANIEAFNAMARMQGGNGSNVVYQVQPAEQVQPGAVTGASACATPVVISPPLTEAPPVNSCVVLPDNVHSLPGGLCLPTAEGGGVPVSFSSANKPCRIQGCNELCVARRPYCLRHSGNRLCEHDGCTKCAQGSTRFCIAHGGGRRCTFPGCDKGARDKFFCAAHGGGKRCSAEGCNKSAVGGSSLCTSHGGGRRCAIDGCEKSAQSSTKFCVKHGGGKKCAHSGCEKVARGRTMYCAAHGGGVRCKLEGCNRVAIGKLQLCRAHGGGAKPRAKSQRKSPPLAPSPEDAPSPPPMAHSFTVAL